VKEHLDRKILPDYEARRWTTPSEKHPGRSQKGKFIRGKTTREKFLEKTLLRGKGCWEWLGSKCINGYGRMRVDGKLVQAHRLAYELFVGPAPANLTADHLCRNPSCVNPEHIEFVTIRDNTLRGIGPSARNATKRECMRGHSDWKTVIRPNGTPRRYCAECTRVQQREKYRRIRALLADQPEREVQFGGLTPASGTQGEGE
jgi:hypothetical protein